jgi:hypothetical protein
VVRSASRKVKPVTEKKNEVLTTKVDIWAHLYDKR